MRHLYCLAAITLLLVGVSTAKADYIIDNLTNSTPLVGTWPISFTGNGTASRNQNSPILGVMNNSASRNVTFAITGDPGTSGIPNIANLNTTSHLFAVATAPGNLATTSVLTVAYGVTSGTQNVSASGLYTKVYVHFTFFDLAGGNPLAVKLEATGGGTANVTQNFSSASGNLEFNMASFAGVNWTAITALTFTITGVNSADYTFDFIGASNPVPVPAGIVMGSMGVVLVGLGAARRRFFSKKAVA